MKYAFIFPGQGSQAIGMGKDFYENFDLARQMFEEASDALGMDMKKLCFEENELINQTQYTQPAILLNSAIAHSILQQEFPLLAKLALGHSLGEISAVYVANGLKFDTAIKLAHQRGILMQKACEGQDAGMMVIVGLEDAILEEYCKKAQSRGKSIYCANYNGDGQIVLAGKKADLQSAEAEIKALGAKRALLLSMSVASHCPILESMSQEFGELLDSMLLDSFSLSVISNATNEAYASKSEALRLLGFQLVKPVLYKQGIAKIDADIDAYLEFGHGGVLKGLNRRLSSKPTYSIDNTSSLKETLELLNA